MQGRHETRAQPKLVSKTVFLTSSLRLLALCRCLQCRLHCATKSFRPTGSSSIAGVRTGCEFYVSTDLDDLQPEEFRELANFTPCDAHFGKRCDTPQHNCLRPPGPYAGRNGQHDLFARSLARKPSLSSQMFNGIKRRNANDLRSSVSRK